MYMQKKIPRKLFLGIIIKVEKMDLILRKIILYIRIYLVLENKFNFFLFVLNQNKVGHFYCKVFN